MTRLLFLACCAMEMQMKRKVAFASFSNQRNDLCDMEKGHREVRAQKSRLLPAAAAAVSNTNKLSYTVS